MTTCYMGPPRFQEQVVSLASALCVALAGLREVLMEGHGLLPGGYDSWPVAEPVIVPGSTISRGLVFHHTRPPTHQLT